MDYDHNLFNPKPKCHEKDLLVITLLTFFSLNLFCQIHWTKHPDNPVLTPGSPGEWDEFYIAVQFRNLLQ